MRTLICVLLCSSVSADCGTHKNAIPGTHRTGTSNFAYQSWADKKAKVCEFGRCVENKSNDYLWVDWKKANVKGYIKPTDSMINTFEWPNHAPKTIDTTLWYGPAPSELATKLLTAVEIDKDVSFLKKLQDTKDTPRLVSRLRGVPGAEGIMEKKPMEVHFSSDVIRLNRGQDAGALFLYRITWEENRPEKETYQGIDIFLSEHFFRAHRKDFVKDPKRSGPEIPVFTVTDKNDQRENGIAIISNRYPAVGLMPIQIGPNGSKGHVEGVISVYLPGP